MTYQIFAFRHSPLFSTTEHIDYLSLVLPVWEFMKDHPSLAVVIILFGFFVLMMYVFSPVICGGALIDLIAKKTQGEPMKGGFAQGLGSFFPLFELATLMAPFGIATFFTELSMVLRNFGEGSWLFIVPMLVFVLVVGTFLTLLFIFAEQFIVLEKENVLQSMKKSAFMVLCNVRDILFLGVAMALIAVRILLNILLVLLIPLLFISIVALMASVALKWLGVLFGVIIGVSMVIAGAYLMAGFHIFVYAVWTLSYLHFKGDQ